MRTAHLPIKPLDVHHSLKDLVYDALKRAIMSMNIYATREELRLDERQLSADLGVSRTPIREAIARLEQEGIVRIVRHRGVYVVRKSKREILEMITVWAALEAMAARLITLHASDGEIATLRALFATFENNQLRAKIDEYSETNIRFHQRILQLGKNALINQIADNLFAHVRSIRLTTIGADDRVERSIIDHMHIIEALEKRDTELAEKLTRQHTLDLATHVDRNVHDLDPGGAATEGLPTVAP
jgi:DNA-binding GntR family transcriptional regulator